MSCGDEHDTSCSEVLEELYRYVDAECDADCEARIRHHLHECGPCLHEYGLEQEVKTLVARCGGGEVAPESLRDRLRAKLRTMVVTGSVEVEVVVELTEVRVEQTTRGRAELPTADHGDGR